MTDRVHGLSNHQDFQRVVASVGHEDGWVAAGLEVATVGPLSRLQELAAAFNREQALIPADHSRYESGMRSGYALCIQAVDDLVRKEQAIAAAKAEYHARNAER